MDKELKVNFPRLGKIRLVVKDKDGKIRVDRSEQSHSWTRNHYNVLAALTMYTIGDSSGLFGAGYMSSKVINGSIRSGAYTSSASDVVKGGLGAANGIIVGTGNTAFSVEDSALASPVTEGTGAGQMSHAAMGNGVLAYDGPSKTWTNTLTRVINNNSGGTITIAEVGLVLNIASIFSSNNQYILIAREVLGVTQDVLNGEQLTVTQDITLDLSAID